MSTRLNSIRTAELAYPATQARVAGQARSAHRSGTAREAPDRASHRHPGWCTQATFGQADGRLSAKAIQLRVFDPQFYRDIAFGGSIGAGEAYIQGYWACDELEGLLRVLIRNRDVLEKMDSGLGRLGAPMQKLFHALNRNTRAGSRKNIAAHYDLGNDFYKLWLDPKMMYSSAYFDSPETSLEDAAVAKLDRICRKLDLSATTPSSRSVRAGVALPFMRPGTMAAMSRPRRFRSNSTTTRSRRLTMPAWKIGLRCCSRTIATWRGASTSWSRLR